MKIRGKLILSGILLLLAAASHSTLTTLGNEQIGYNAISQMTNASYTSFVLKDQLWRWAPKVLGGMFLLLAALIWRKNIKQLFLSGLCAMVLLAPSPDANAYYSKSDWAEVYNVLPNHSAFMIPAVGDTSTQKQFETEAFLNEKKVGAKRIQIPHVVMKNTGLIDAYVPGAVLVLLDRTPYVVTWTKDATPGSPSNQEMCIESQDSIEICFNASIGANVTEEDAAKYLYWFGTEPPTGNDDERKYPSMLSGKSLPEVVNNRVYQRIHSEYSVEFSKYPLSELLTHKADVIKAVEKRIITEYKAMGITIEYVGIASQFRYTSKEVQGSINTLVASAYASKAANARLDAAKVDRFEAETQIMLNQSAPYAKWDGKSFPTLPGTIVGMDSIMDWAKSILQTKP
jgi:hypothetical protein